MYVSVWKAKITGPEYTEYTTVEKTTTRVNALCHDTYECTTEEQTTTRVNAQNTQQKSKQRHE